MNNDPTRPMHPVFLVTVIFSVAIASVLRDHVFLFGFNPLEMITLFQGVAAFYVLLHKCFYGEN
jgi:hypothetical protein